MLVSSGLEEVVPVAGIMVSSLLISLVRASSLKYLPHTGQYQYSLFPASVAVAALASVFSASWPLAAITSLSQVVSFWQAASVKYLPHPAQYQYS